MPGRVPLGFSLAVHGWLLWWVASGPAGAAGRVAKPSSLYDQVIAPNRNKIVWYSFRKLPDISPLERHGISKPPKAVVKAPQEILSRAAAPPARQLIWQPAPRIEIHEELRAPNLLAFHDPHIAPPERPKLFAPPPEPKPQAPPRRQIPVPPDLRAAARPPESPLPFAGPTARPQPRAFVLPKIPRPAPSRAASLAAPPTLAASLDMQRNPALAFGTRLPTRPGPRDFRLPQFSPGGAPAPAALPAAPRIAAEADLQNSRAIPGTALAVPRRRSMTLPPGFDEPGVEHPSTAPAVGAAPTLSASSSTSAPNLAIVGLNPAERLEGSIPEGARNARFSGGPNPRLDGGTGEPVSGAKIFVPDLMVRGGEKAAAPALMARNSSPTSQANLAAAMHSAPPVPPPAGSPLPSISPPGPGLHGRVVYSMTVQMPNITSYSGSWVMWFAERGPKQGIAGLKPPFPLHKVDPKYVPAAMAEHVEGTVRLAAVIRKDGGVDSIAILKRVDDRLDRTAVEALSKWEFEPASRDGNAVDLDVIVDIPFRLAPVGGR